MTESAKEYIAGFVLGAVILPTIAVCTYFLYQASH